jgi:hypothetical protein
MHSFFNNRGEKILLLGTILNGKLFLHSKKLKQKEVSLIFNSPGSFSAQENVFDLVVPYNFEYLKNFYIFI